MRPVRYLVLWLTNACNLRCRYCYRGEDSSIQAMPKSTIRQALQLSARSGRCFHVQLAGGEPTLEPERIEFVAKSVREAGMQATIGLQTNGTLLDAALARLCRRHAIEVGMSLDGPPGVHDPLRGGFRQTLQGLEVLAEHGVSCRVTAVVSAQNCAHLDRLALLLAGFPQVHGLGLDLLVQKGRARAGVVQPATRESLRTGIASLLGALEKINRLRARPLKLREQEQVLRTCNTKKARLLCHASLGESLAVHPDGRVYPCSQTVGDPDFLAGTLDAIQWERLEMAITGFASACSGCCLADHCPGECPSRRHYNARNDPSIGCLLYQTVFEHLQTRSVA